MTEKKMYDAAAEFVAAIRKSAEYSDYQVQLTKLQKEPELFRLVNDFRIKNYNFQNTYEGEDMLERMDELDREREQLRENSLIEHFLEAETAFCRMMQEINMLITRELDFQ